MSSHNNRHKSKSIDLPVSKVILLDSSMSPQAVITYMKFIDNQCGTLFNLINVTDPNNKIRDNNKVDTTLSDADIINIIGSRSLTEITKFRQSIGSDYMKQNSNIIQRCVLCCNHLEYSFSKSMQSRLMNIEEYIQLKRKGDPYILMQWIFSTFIHKSDKSTYLDVLHKSHKDFSAISQGPGEEINLYNSRFDITLNHYLRSRYNYIQFQLDKDSNNNLPPTNNGSLSIFDTLSLRTIVAVVPTDLAVHNIAALPVIPGWNPANTTDHFLNNAILVHHYMLSLNSYFSEAFASFKNDSRSKLKFTDLAEAKEYVIGYLRSQRPSTQRPNMAYSTAVFKCYTCGEPGHSSRKCPNQHMNDKIKDPPPNRSSVTISSTSDEPSKKKKKFSGNKKEKLIN